MFETDNFKIVVPTSEEFVTYSKDDVWIEDGRGMDRTNEDVDLFMRIEEVWSRKVKEAFEKGRTIFPGPLYRLSSYMVSVGKLVLSLGPTDYREFLGTNVEAGKDPEYMKTLILRGSERSYDTDAFISNPLAICSVVETSDGKIVAGLRSDKVGEYPRCWHTVGGHPDPRHYQHKRPDMFDAMAREIESELGIDRNEIEDMRLLGLMRNTRTRKPELLFETRLSIPYNGIKARRGTERDEHLAIFGVDSIDALIDFLNANQGNFSFPEPNNLSSAEMVNLKPSSRPQNTTSFIVPPGEANWIMYLATKDVDISKRLTYVRIN